MYKRQPYVCATPYGSLFSETVLQALEEAADTGINTVPYTSRQTDGAQTVLIGESVTAGSLAAAITAETGLPTRVLCPTEAQPALLAAGDAMAEDEDELLPQLAGAQMCIRDRTSTARKRSWPSWASKSCNTKSALKCPAANCR